VIQTIAGDVSMLDTFNGVVPLLIAEFFRVSLIIAVPILTLLLIR
jgi:TRAP-type C4-dicarboxylate transport system permease large subunit